MIKSSFPKGESFTKKGSSEDILEQMKEFETDLRANMGPPANSAAIDKLLPVIEAFLETNKETLETIMKNNGFSMTGPYSITSEFDTAISSIEEYLANPLESLLYLLNEAITQMNYYLNNKHP